MVPLTGRTKTVGAAVGPAPAGAATPGGAVSPSARRRAVSRRMFSWVYTWDAEGRGESRTTAYDSVLTRQIHGARERAWFAARLGAGASTAPRPVTGRFSGVGASRAAPRGRVLAPLAYWAGACRAGAGYWHPRLLGQARAAPGPGTGTPAYWGRRVAAPGAGYWHPRPTGAGACRAGAGYWHPRPTGLGQRRGAWKVGRAAVRDTGSGEAPVHRGVPPYVPEPRHLAQRVRQRFGLMKRP